MGEHYLQGGCSCGRNQYEIVIPSASEANKKVQVIFGEASELHRAHASILPTLLRIPLPHLQSTTYAYTHSERPVDIKKIFTPTSAPHTKRNFCGYCGTPLTFWTEEHPDEAEFICVNLASLERPSLELLDSLGILPTAEEEEDIIGSSRSGQILGETTSSDDQRPIRGAPWFEELIETGPLGRIKKMRGGQRNGSGRSVVEWEIIEVEGDSGLETPPKRQMTGIATDEDDKMNV